MREPLRDASGAIVLADGVTGGGEVIHAAKAGFGGRAGELIVTARYLQCGAARIPLGHFRFAATGTDNSQAAAGVNVAAAGASVLAPLAGIGALAVFAIQGGQVNVPAGTPALARVNADVALDAAALAACQGPNSSTKGVRE